MVVPLQLPGANAGKPDVAGAAKDAVKKGPLGFINMGDLAFDLPGANVTKDDIPNKLKPSEAKGLPEGPTAKPPSLPSLPKVCSPCSQHPILTYVKNNLLCQHTVSACMQLQTTTRQSCLHFSNI